MNVLIVGYYGFKNTGDELILAKIIEDIKKYYPSSKITVWSGNKNYTRKIHGVDAIDRFSVDETVNAIRKSDLVVVGGGGLINEYYPVKLEGFFKEFGKNIPSYAIVPFLAKIMDIPVIYWTHGVGPIFSSEGAHFCRWFYNLADTVTVRDAYSYDLLKSLGIEEEKLYLDMDPVLKLDLQQLIDGPELNEGIANVSKDLPRVGVNIRPWFGVSNLIDKLYSSFKMLLEKKEFLIVPVPFDLNLDIKPLEDLLKKFDSRYVDMTHFYNLETPKDVISLVNSVDFFIGMRLHSLIVSYLLKKKTLGLVYDLKVDELSKKIGVDVLPIGRTSEVDIYMGMNRLFNKNSNSSSKEKPAQELECITPDVFYDLSSSIENKKKAVLNIDFKDDLIVSMRDEIFELRGKLQQIDLLKREIESLREEKGAAESKLEVTQRELKEAKSNIEELNSKLKSVNDQLREIYSSDFWKVASWYYKQKEKNIIIKILHRLLRPFKKVFFYKKESVVSTVENQKSPDKLLDFISKQAGKDFFVIFAGVRFTDNEGQRSVRITQSLAKLGKPSIFVYHNWSKEDMDEIGEKEKDIYVLPKDYFLDRFLDYFKFINNVASSSTILIEYPERKLIKPLMHGKILGFKTVYDILDDWEDFSRGNIAPWYDPNVELFILRNTDYRFAVSRPLLDKFSRFELELLPNGFAPDKLISDSEIRLEKGEVTVGYFGYLDKNVFDWGLLIECAKRNPGYIFYLLGYAMPKDIALPKNVIYLGHVPPQKLFAYARNWDVCINLKTDVFKSSDPIKIYEYLYFKKPVITTGGMEHLRDIPYVISIQNNVEQFEEAIKVACGIRIDESKIEKFLKGKSWLDRTQRLLEAIGLQ